MSIIPCLSTAAACAVIVAATPCGAAVALTTQGVPVVNTFDTRPSIFDFSTSSFLDSIGGAGLATSPEELDEVINDNPAVDAFVIFTELPSTDSWPATQNAAGRYNTGLNTGAPNGGFLQFRPTSSAYVLTKMTLANDTGSAIRAVTISYDYFVATPGSSANEEINGLRAYYSLIGSSGTWINIPALSATTAVTTGTILAPEKVSVTLDLSDTPWETFLGLHVIWVDDNGSPSADGQTAAHERGYAIDNLSFTGYAIPEPGAASILVLSLAGMLTRRTRRPANHHRS